MTLKEFIHLAPTVLVLVFWAAMLWKTRNDNN